MNDMRKYSSRSTLNAPLPRCLPSMNEIQVHVTQPTSWEREKQEQQSSLDSVKVIHSFIHSFIHPRQRSPHPGGRMRKTLTWGRPIIKRRPRGHAGLQKPPRWHQPLGRRLHTDGAPRHHNEDSCLRILRRHLLLCMITLLKMPISNSPYEKKNR